MEPSRLAALAALLADGTRAAFCLALLDGRAWTAGELARHAGVASSTASEHLGKLVTGGLLAEERQGRHRCVRLADDRTAYPVEALAAHTGPVPAGPPRSLVAASARDAMARGRTCYDHLAGRAALSAGGGRLRGRGDGPERRPWWWRCPGRRWTRCRGCGRWRAARCAWRVWRSPAAGAPPRPPRSSSRRGPVPGPPPSEAPFVKRRRG
ncbi:winged helix-turn-helix domain-containing protein [Streptomyces sp. PR69]|uniref:winged helix-turn-helix domain-containing protein n=1 Tax=Streptomyces sp. PR69 TaxID=2984950 RepID=UPI0022649D36|nr:winged helix-turn-helix domain-containing protein [Streptomyces sp. PR69]